ncbi:hypothetical protein ACQ5SO_10610 [Rhodovulum sp. DZ06]|uniref:hypothetical protein n=1 Tax=Rhodovulum sp. DZ06 TaxID=3425126 RepID=UPI003D33AF7B
MSRRGPLLISRDSAGVALEQEREAVMAFQLLADSMERFDTLLMEVRHLQANLIYTMRFPELHAALRFEESFIFGGVEAIRPSQSGQAGWTRLFASSLFKGPSATIPRLAEAFVPLLPVRDDDKRAQMPDGDLKARARRPGGGAQDKEAQWTPEPAFPDLKLEGAFPEFQSRLAVADAWRAAVAPISRALRRRALSGQWDDSFETHYAGFAALQSLKRNLVHDKLHVAYYGLRAFNPSAIGVRGASDERKRIARGDFLLARSIAHANMALSIRRLEDFHASFEKTIDLGLQENHRPITGRRREQGVYHQMLGERSRELFIDTSRLVRRLLSKDDEEGDEDTLFPGMPTFIHRWAHNYTSNNAETLGITRSNRSATGRRRGRKSEDYIAQMPSFSSFAVNTSFWMPDRPDLQPVIAHEAAHCVLVEVFGDMASPLERTGLHEPLTELWQGLMSVKSDRLAEIDSEETHARHESEMREILADILAATVTGPGYLFALFQELLGTTVGRIAQRSDWREWRDLGMLERILEEGAGYVKLSRFWYLRLVVIADVLHATQPVPAEDGLADTMTDGVVGCVRLLHDRLRALHRPKLGDDVDVDDWDIYARMIVTRIRTSGALHPLMQFRRDTGGLHAPAADRLNSKAAQARNDVLDDAPTGGALTRQMHGRLVEFMAERKAAQPDRASHWLLTPGRCAERTGRLLEGGTPPFRAARSFLGLHAADRLAAWAAAVDQGLDATFPALRSADSLIAFTALYVTADDRTLRHMRRARQALADMGPAADPKAQRDRLDDIVERVPVFRQLGDVPWQSSMFRTMELFAKVNGRTPDGREWCLLETLSSDFAPGREVVQLAIEMWFFQRRNATDALAELVRMLMNLTERPVGDMARWHEGVRTNRFMQDVVHDIACTLGEGEGDAELERGLERLREAWAKAALADPRGRAAQADAPSWPDLLARQLEQVEADIRARKASGDPGRAPRRDQLRELYARRIGGVILGWLGADLDADFLELEFLREFWDKSYGALAQESRPHLRTHAALVFAEILERQLGPFRPERVEKARADLEKAIATAKPAAQPITKDFDDWRDAAVKRLNDIADEYRELDADAFQGQASAHLVALRRLARDLGSEMLQNLDGAFWAERDHTFRKIDESAVAPTDEAAQIKALRDFAFSPLVRRLSDNMVQSLRVFEIGRLIGAADRLHNAKAFDSADFEGLGALQILKLDRAYPDGVMPMHLPDRQPFRDIGVPGDRSGASMEKLLAALDRLRTKKGKPPYTASEVEREVLWMELSDEPTQPVCDYIKRLFRDDAHEQVVREPPSLADVMLVGATAQRVLKRRLLRIGMLKRQALIDGWEILKTASRDPQEAKERFQQAKARPLHMRHSLHLRTARRLSALKARRFRDIRPVIDPMARSAIAFGPVNALLELAADREKQLADRRTRSPVLEDFSTGLTEACTAPGETPPDAGDLRGFRSMNLSRMSLIDTHWWRDFGCVTKPTDPEASQAHFLQPDPRRIGAPDGGAPRGLRRFATLGRYDYFLFSDTQLLGQLRLPILDPRAPRVAGKLYADRAGSPFSRINQEFGFRAFFERREQTISVSLGAPPVDLLADKMIAATARNAPTGSGGGAAPHRKSDLLAVLSIRLDRRASRLGFVHRLRAARRAWTSPDRPLATPQAEAAMIRALRRAVGLNERFDLADAEAARFKTLCTPVWDGAAWTPDALRKVFEAEPTTHPFHVLAEEADDAAPSGGRLRDALELARCFGDLPSLTVETIGGFLADGDSLLLGEGWSDIYLLIHCDAPPEDEDVQARKPWLANGARRLYDVFSLQHAIFQDHQVLRTEMFLRPVSIPFAAADAERFNASLAVRTREDRELDGQIQRMVDAARSSVLRSVLGRELSDATREEIRKARDEVTIHHIPGRNDLEFQLRRLDAVRKGGPSGTGLQDMSPSKALEAVHELVGAGAESGGAGSEEIVTRIGFRHFSGEGR